MLFRMEFGILGPLEVLDQGRDLTPARAKQRCLLAMLLLHANKVVTSDELIDALWGEAPPETAQTAVHGHVSALRKLLGADRIETRFRGYLLRLSGDELDLTGFEMGVAQARGEGDLAARRDRLQTALALWRGEALADFRHERFAQAEAARLEELRLSSLEELIDADLALGRHREVVPELERLVAEHRFRERLRGQLMLALYRSGRQAHAVQVFQDGRRAFVEELGIEPGELLRQLEKQILNQDPSLALEEPEATVPPPLRHAEVAGRERKVVTVLFADLVGFTARAEQLDPEEIDAILRPYHARLRGELERFGGTVEKFIGDAVMAIFGAPVAHEDDPDRAVRAALAIRDWVREQEGLEVRIAVNTGEALVTLDDRSPEEEPIAVGDVLNTAARLEAAAPTNAVLVGERTYRATDDAFEYREAEPIEAKGKREPLPAWEPLKACVPLGAVAPGRRVPLVGRKQELDALRDALVRARRHRSTQLVTLVGVPGIGKSRLVSELHEAIQADGEPVSWRQGRSLPYGDGVSFWALGEIVKAESGVLESDTPDEARRKVRRAANRATEDTAQAEWLGRHLETLVGRGDEGPVGGDRGESFAAWGRFIEALAEQRPLVLVFEDIHWADDGLLDFVDELVDWATGVPLVALCTARPELLERRPGWGGGKPNALTLSLLPLSGAETTRLVAALLDRAELSAEAHEHVLARAEGNPLYAEQYARMVAERGEREAMPETVHGVIAARLDALSREEKSLLQGAAVVGKVFWSGVTEAIGVLPSDSDAVLRALERKEFVHRRRRSAVAGEAEYSFRHVLLRDVAYAQIPRAARAEKHRRAAKWIESLGRPDDHAETIAHHYLQALEYAPAATGERAALVELARRAAREAGDRAMSMSAYAAAARFYAKALELSPMDDPERPRLLLGRGRALFFSEGSGLELLVKALDAFRAAGDVEGAAEAATTAARVVWFGGDRKGADAYMELALELLAKRPPSAATAHALVARSGYQGLAGKFASAIRLAREALPLAEQFGLDAQRSRALMIIGAARVDSGDAAGVQDIERSIEIARDAGSLDMVGNGYANLVSELFILGRLGEAAQARTALREVYETSGIAWGRRTALAEQAGEAFLHGKWDEALRIVDTVIAEADAGRSDYMDPMCFSLRAAVRLGRGDLAGAEADSERAVELARRSDAQAQAQAFTGRALVALAEGRLEEAAGLASDLTAMGPVLLPALCAPYPTLAEVAWVLRDLEHRDELFALLDATPLASPWVETGRAIAAGDLVRAAEILAELGHGACAAYASLRLAESLRAAGSKADGNVHLARALDFYRRAGATDYVSRGEALLSASV
jgi:class 3 adenylate cyclase/tetratricopeptide (TPR) repeat protein